MASGNKGSRPRPRPKGPVSQDRSVGGRRKLLARNTKATSAKRKSENR